MGSTSSTRGLLRTCRGGLARARSTQLFLLPAPCPSLSGFWGLCAAVDFVLSSGVAVGDVALLFPTSAVHAGWVGASGFTLEADVAASATF